MSDAPVSDEHRLSPLHERHVALGAKLAGFGGWSMPLEYAAGTVKEHLAVRTAVGIFDVSHLGKAMVTGPGAAAHVNATLSNDLGKIGPGQAQYTLCCDDATGGIVDDLIAYYHDDEHLLLIPNAANTAEVCRRLREAAPDGVQVVDHHTDYAVLALQGPRADEVMTEVGLPVGHDYMSFVESRVGGHPAGRRAAPATPASGATSWSCVPRQRADSGTRCWQRASRSACSRADWAPATRCARRWATRSTARTSPST